MRIYSYRAWELSLKPWFFVLCTCVTVGCEGYKNILKMSSVSSVVLGVSIVLSKS
jgi:hypothetical protein